MAPCRSRAGPLIAATRQDECRHSRARYSVAPAAGSPARIAGHRWHLKDAWPTPTGSQTPTPRPHRASPRVFRPALPRRDRRPAVAASWMDGGYGSRRGAPALPEADAALLLGNGNATVAGMQAICCARRYYKRRRRGLSGACQMLGDLQTCAGSKRKPAPTPGWLPSWTRWESPVHRASGFRVHRRSESLGPSRDTRTKHQPHRADGYGQAQDANPGRSRDSHPARLAILVSAIDPATAAGEPTAADAVLAIWPRASEPGTKSASLRSPGSEQIAGSR